MASRLLQWRLMRAAIDRSPRLLHVRDWLVPLGSAVASVVLVVLGWSLTDWANDARRNLFVPGGPADVSVVQLADSTLMDLGLLEDAEPFLWVAFAHLLGGVLAALLADRLPRLRAQLELVAVATLIGLAVGIVTAHSAGVSAIAALTFVTGAALVLGWVLFAAGTVTILRVARLGEDEPRPRGEKV